MRVISGSLKGRQFRSPSGHRTHPMSEKIRGALFNALGDLAGLSVLDAFAGSGALGFEAASRGAGSVVLVEKSSTAYKTIVENIEKLDLEEIVKASRANVSSWLSNNLDSGFDVVIADPPYDHLVSKLLEKVSSAVKQGGILVLSWPGSEEMPKMPGFDHVSDNNFGDSQLIFYKKN